MLVPNRAGESSVHVGGSGAHGGFVQGATALKGELAERAALSVGSSLAPQVETVAEKRAEARMKGYVGESCPECGNFTMVRNGTCLKCVPRMRQFHHGAEWHVFEVRHLRRDHGVQLSTRREKPSRESEYATDCSTFCSSNRVA